MDEATSTRQARVLFDHAEKDPVTADPDGTLDLPLTAYTKHRWAELNVSSASGRAPVRPISNSKTPSLINRVRGPSKMRIPSGSRTFLATLAPAFAAYLSAQAGTPVSTERQGEHHEGAGEDRLHRVETSAPRATSTSQTTRRAKTASMT